MNVCVYIQKNDAKIPGGPKMKLRGPSLGVEGWVEERVAPRVEGGVDHDGVLRRRSSSTSHI